MQLRKLVIASYSPPSPSCRIALRFKHFRGIHVMTARERKGRRTIMTTFTITEDNNISAFATKEEAAAAIPGTFEVFASQKELTQLATTWGAERLVAIWNSLPGVKGIKGFKNARAGAGRIWERIQGLGDAAKPEAEKPKAAPKATGSAKAPKGAPTKGKSGKKATLAKKTPKAKAFARAENAGSREGSKTAQVVAMLQRKNGATISEIMDKMGWQKHTVRGFMAGAMKKAGYAVESFKPEGGERTYRINA
jgi:hypothetical protein